MEPNKSTVLVTGGTGFVGAHCILHLLQQGYGVRTTVRSHSRAQFVRDMLHTGGATPSQTSSVEFWAADLAQDAGWAEACADCEYVLHVAAPMSGAAAAAASPDSLIGPARDGALRVLRAAKAGGVRRVVMTSSWAAVAFGHGPRDHPFTEHDWTVLDGPHATVPPYHRSKTLAERAAWDWVRSSEGAGLQLAVINPTGVLGPVLAREAVSSNELLVSMLTGQMPGVLRLSFPLVDVRDLADLHVRAMTCPAAAGERFVAVSAEGSIWCRQVAEMLKTHLGAAASKVSARELPDWAFRVFGWFDADIAEIVPELSVEKKSTSDKARTLLGWQPRPAQETVVDAAESLIRLEVVK